MSYGLFAEFYDELTANVDYDARAARMDALIRRFKPDAHLLVDLACGTGSMTVRFAAMGYDVIGVDLSEDMLSRAREKSDSRILYLRQPLERLDMYGTIDAFVCSLDSLNHITDRARLSEALRRVALFMEPDGVFVFDMNTPYKHEHVLGDNAFVFETDDLYCVWQNEYAGGGRVDITLDFFLPTEDGRYERADESFAEVAYSMEETETLLREAGLEIVAAYDDLTDCPPHAQSERILYAAQKITGKD